MGYAPRPVAQGGQASGRRRRLLERGIALAIALLPPALVGLRCATSPDTPFVVQRSEAPWIMAPSEVSAALQQWGETQVPVTSFTRVFDAGAGDAGLRLRLRAYGSLRVEINGREVEGARRDAARWREPLEVDAGAWLRPGPNEIRVDVANARGPALLSLRGEGPTPPLRSDAGWSVRAGESVHAGALLADDTRINPRSLAVETPAEALRDKADALLALLVLGGAACLGFRRLRPARGAWLGSPAVPLLASAGWLYLYFAKTARIPAAVGFDARHHLQYVHYILENGSLPLAAEGWSTFHPPLFYALCAGLVAAGGDERALKLLPLLAGLGVVWMAWLLARRLRPGAPQAAGLAALFAAVLPVNLYSAAYFSNETLHALFASAALLLGAGLLRAEGVARGPLLACAALFGVAALTKFTVLVTLPVALFFLAWKLVGVERWAPGRVAAALGAFALVVLALAGWFYARNWVHYGSPAVANWGALPGEGRIWWQQPGFHTPAYYLKFGQALVHPYLAGFHSFWDSVYSTFWGDGFIAGRTDPYRRHDFWDYGFMSAGYWLALPASALLLLGGGRLLAEALGDGPPRQRLALGFLASSVWAVCLAFLALTLQLPFFAQAKATYLLMLAAPLALAFAEGCVAVDGWLAERGWQAARVALCAWLASFAGALFLSHAA